MVSGAVAVRRAVLLPQRGFIQAAAAAAAAASPILPHDKIQKTMAVGFKGRTLLCIAHRLRTIVGYDRICVMDAGRIAELDTPLNLWQQGGIFRSMCDRSGIRVEDIHASMAGLNPDDADGDDEAPEAEGSGQKSEKDE